MGGIQGGSSSGGLLGRSPAPSDTTGYGQQAGGMHPTGMHSSLGILNTPSESPQKCVTAQVDLERQPCGSVDAYTQCKRTFRGFQRRHPHQTASDIKEYLTSLCVTLQV